MTIKLKYTCTISDAGAERYKKEIIPQGLMIKENQKLNKGDNIDFKSSVFVTENVSLFINRHPKVATAYFRHNEIIMNWS